MVKEVLGLVVSGPFLLWVRDRVRVWVTLTYTIKHILTFTRYREGEG
jgi:hypothetical protein